MSVKHPGILYASTSCIWTRLSPSLDTLRQRWRLNKDREKPGNVPKKHHILGALALASINDTPPVGSQCKIKDFTNCSATSGGVKSWPRAASTSRAVTRGEDLARTTSYQSCAVRTMTANHYAAKRETEDAQQAPVIKLRPNRSNNRTSASAKRIADGRWAAHQSLKDSCALGDVCNENRLDG